LSHKPSPIKVAATAPSKTKRANQIRIKTAKTGKVTAVVAIMSIFSKKDAMCGTLNPGMRSLLTKRWKVPIYQRNILAYG
jgi:hypothetical protein